MATKAAIPLSEAIALGRHLTAPCIGGRSRGGAGFGCALDMAMDAIGKWGHWTMCARHWPWLREPSGVNDIDSWSLTIGHKFDADVMISKRMTMDAFIDWVKEIEAKYEVQEDESIVAVNDEKVVA